MIKKSTILFLAILLITCKSNKNTLSISQEKKSINKVVTQWHKAAASANFEEYFFLMTADAVFIGTDATENWKIDDFKTFSKPYFNKGKAWTFKTTQRNVFVSKSAKIAWFDELLDTDMGSCRGSGVLKKDQKQWKIAHYVLSITIPNDAVKKVILLKNKQDSILFNK